jgi:hypothetical protein
VIVGKIRNMNQQIEDKIVLRVLARFNERSQLGITKYNTTLEREDYSLVNWLREAQAEAMDFALYCEAAINRIEKDGSKTT